MQLPSELSKLKDKDILLFVAGKQEAKLYHASLGSLEEILAVSVPRPKYSDNEGIYSTSANGRVYSGSVELRQDEVIILEFIHELEKNIKNLKLSFDEIYYLAPDQSRHHIKESLPKDWQSKITYERFGNFVSESPLDLLMKVMEEKKIPFYPITNEEKKILSIPKQP